MKEDFGWVLPVQAPEHMHMCFFLNFFSFFLFRYP